MASIIDIKDEKPASKVPDRSQKAMKLVSTVKLQRAKQRADESKHTLIRCMRRSARSLQSR